MDIFPCAQCGEKIYAQWNVCPVCSHPTETTGSASSRILCLQCNGAITAEDLSCPHCHVPIIRRYCSDCKRLIPDHVLFCPYCGATPEKKRTVQKLLKIASIGAGAGALSILLLLYLRSPSTAPQKPVPPVAPVQQAKQYEAFQHPVESTAAAEPVSLIPAEPAAMPAASKPFDGVDLTPPEPTNTVVVAPHPQEEVPVTVLVERGARLMQGRKLSKIGAHYIRSGRYDQAVIVLRKAIETFPPETRDVTYGESLYHLGYSLRMSGKPEEAIPVLKQALKFPLYNTKVSKELKTASAQIKKSR